MNTTQLECFMTVANFLNFSRAAEVLRITQPAVSHQINALENELGVKLFHRTSKSVRLTQAGYLFTQYADEILRISGLSKERLKAAQEVHSVRLGVGCRNFVDLRLMIPTLSQLATEEPLLLPLLRMTPFDSLENLLEEGDIQVLISHKKTSLKKAVYRELCLRPVVCLCSAQHPLAQLEQVSVHQLRDAGRMAICRPPIFSTELLDVQSQVVSGRNSEQILFCDNLEILYTLVEAGLAPSSVHSYARDLSHLLWCFLPAGRTHPRASEISHFAGGKSTNRSPCAMTIVHQTCPPYPRWARLTHPFPS